MAHGHGRALVWSLGSRHSLILWLSHTFHSWVYSVCALTYSMRQQCHCNKKKKSLSQVSRSWGGFGGRRGAHSPFNDFQMCSSLFPRLESIHRRDLCSSVNRVLTNSSGKWHKIRPWKINLSQLHVLHYIIKGNQTKTQDMNTHPMRWYVKDAWIKCTFAKTCLGEHSDNTEKPRLICH